MKMDIKDVGYKQYPIERTKRGLPAVWEAGGGYTNTGWARVVADKNGAPKSPIYIRKRGELACSDHALIIIQPGDYVIEADHHRGDFNIEVLRVERIPMDPEDPGYREATVETVATFDEGEWLPEPPHSLKNAIEAVKAKATDYHCRHPIFVVGDDDE